jgi:hypothetical protein
VRHDTIVNTYDPTLAPICQGKRHGPAQFGRTPGRIAESAAGLMWALHLPVGHPRDASSGQPLVVQLEQASARVGRHPIPAIHALAGALARTDATVREALHARGILSVGLPKTVEPLPPSPSPEGVSRSLSEAGWQDIRTPTQGPLACAGGYSRPVVERIMASLLGRGPGQLADKGHRGAIVHTGRAVMVHRTATLGRIPEYRLS